MSKFEVLENPDGQAMMFGPFLYFIIQNSLFDIRYSDKKNDGIPSQRNFLRDPLY